MDGLGYVFTRLDGQQLYPGTVTQLMGRFIRDLANRLGHSDPAITLRGYAHVINESSPPPARAFAKAVAGIDDEDDQDPR